MAHNIATDVKTLQYQMQQLILAVQTKTPTVPTPQYQPPTQYPQPAAYAGPGQTYTSGPPRQQQYQLHQQTAPFYGQPYNYGGGYPQGGRGGRGWNWGRGRGRGQVEEGDIILFPTQQPSNSRADTAVLCQV